jgi:flagellar FliJ protein
MAGKTPKKKYVRRFNFKLEKILKLRENREREAELELGKAVGVLSALELRIKNIALEKMQAAEHRFSGGNDFYTIRSYDLYILRLDQTKDALLEAAARAELEVEKARAIYLEASRDRKVISKLKERQEKEYRRAMNLEEIKLIDDLSGGVVARRIAAG